MLKNSWNPVKVPKKCVLFPKACMFLLNNSDYTCFGVVASLCRVEKSGSTFSWVGEWYLQQLLKLLEGLVHLPTL